jgi:hypothetical protein
VSTALSVFAPVSALAAAIVGLVTWYISDRRKSAAETTVAEATVQSDIDKRDIDAREARLLYVEKQMDMERAFHLMFSKLFWEDAGERAGKTLAQTILSALLVAGATGVLGVHWPTLLATAGTAALISLLSSVVSLPVGGNGTASLLRSLRAPGRHEAAHPPTPEV